MKTRDVIDIMLGFVMFGLILFSIHQCARIEEQKEDHVVIKSDTTILNVVDTIVYYRPQPALILPIHTRDTIVKVDSVEVQVPVVSNVYKDSTYECQVSGGYFTSLDYIKVYPKRSYITIHDTEVIRRKPIISVSVGVGAGYDIWHKNVSPIVGVFVGVPVWSIYAKEKRHTL